MMTITESMETLQQLREFCRLPSGSAILGMNRGVIDCYNHGLKRWREMHPEMSLDEIRGHIAQSADIAMRKLREHN